MLPTMARTSGEPTEHEGITRLKPLLYRVRVTGTNPRTGKRGEIDRKVEGTERDALIKKGEWLKELTEAPVVDAGLVGLPERPRVKDCARYWLSTKLASKITEGTAEKYTNALEHFEAACGNIYFDTLKSTDIMSWIALERKAGHAASSIDTWLRVVRPMVRDLLEPLGRTVDPMHRVTVGELTSKYEGENSMTPEQLGAFLDAVRMECPQHYAVIIFMAYTGMRHCHASALEVGDLDEVNMEIHVKRSNVHGAVAKTSRRKAVAKEFPLTAVLLNVLVWHRARLKRHHKKNWKGHQSNLVFPSRMGKIRTGGSNMRKGWLLAQKAAGLEGVRLTPQSLRRTFVDLGRRGGIDPIIARTLTGHVTESMTRRYSTVRQDERHVAVATIQGLVPHTVVPPRPVVVAPEAPSRPVVTPCPNGGITGPTPSADPPVRPARVERRQTPALPLPEQRRNTAF